MIFRRACTAVAIAAVAAGTLAACKGETRREPDVVVTVTAPPTTPSASGSTSGSASGSPTSSAAAGGSASAAPTGMKKLPGRCETLLASPAITDAIGQTIPGKTAYVVGTAEADTGRITYINCRYGVGKNATNPKLEIGVSLYKSAGQAAARIPLTITDFENNSATEKKISVDGIPASYLTGGQASGYGPSIVLSYGQRTFAITFRTDVFPAAEVEKKLLAVTRLALARTAPK